MFKLDKHEGFGCVLRGAISVDGAAAGVLFSTESNRSGLIMEAEIGLSTPMVAFVRSITPGDGSATGNATLQRHRVVIREVATDYAGTSRKQAALGAGIHAATATPLIDSRMRLLGILTVFYSKPHHPSYEALRRLDGCCKVAAQLLEVLDLYAPTDTHPTRPTLVRGRLAPDVLTAVLEVERLLPLCGRGHDDETVFAALARHLEMILRRTPKLR
jgi:hypothetical protein